MSFQEPAWETRWHRHGRPSREDGCIEFPAAYAGANRTTMNEPEKIIHDLETEFPALSGIAFATAQNETLASGQSVLQSENGVIYEVYPDGMRREHKRIEPPTRVLAGRKIAIR